MGGLELQGNGQREMASKVFMLRSAFEISSSLAQFLLTPLSFFACLGCFQIKSNSVL